MTAVRNNVTRLLEAKKIPFTALTFPAEKLSAVEAASHMGLPPELVYKTIVVTRPGKGKPLLVLVPALHEVDLKKVAREVGEKKVSLPTEREAEQMTGLQAGGISPLALLRGGFQVLLDASARQLPEITISGGMRGLNIRLDPDDLLALTTGRYADVATELPA
jgi:Cys-tRNA(Pro)/Cys-tRNA(Cys) deacylase